MHLRVVVGELHGEVHVEPGELRDALLAVELLGGSSVWGTPGEQSALQLCATREETAKQPGGKPWTP